MASVCHTYCIKVVHKNIYLLGEEQLLITVEVPGRHSMSKKEKKRSSIISSEISLSLSLSLSLCLVGGDHWYEIVITTNMKQVHTSAIKN